MRKSQLCTCLLYTSRDSKEKYTQLVYLKDYQILKDMYEEFDENISVDLLNDYEKNIEN